MIMIHKWYLEQLYYSKQLNDLMQSSMYNVYPNTKKYYNYYWVKLNIILRKLSEILNWQRENVNVCMIDTAIK